MLWTAKMNTHSQFIMSTIQYYWRKESQNVHYTMEWKWVPHIFQYKQTLECLSFNCESHHARTWSVRSENSFIINFEIIMCCQTSYEYTFTLEVKCSTSMPVERQTMKISYWSIRTLDVNSVLTTPLYK